MDLFARTSAWQSFRHKLSLVFQKRTSDTFTRFLRVPAQFDALSGPVLDFLLADNPVAGLEIVVVGCSNGAEVYSIASILKRSHPLLDFRVHGVDIDQQMVNHARSGCYTAEEVFAHGLVTPTFVEATFLLENGRYWIKEETAQHVDFGIADVLDPALVETVGTADIVFAQNLLYHFKPRTAKKAFGNICRLLKLRAALFIDGMDLCLRTKLTRLRDLRPLDYRIEEIHNDARRIRASGWPCIYWALEPFSASRSDWQRRYATIFIRDVPS